MTLAFPSEIVQLNVHYQDRSVRIKIPKDECFRVNQIFEQDGYRIPEYQSHIGPLLVFDVGANVGLYAVYMKMKYPQSIIHCFEPSSNTLALCRANTGSFSRITIHPYGLYNEEQETVMYIHPANTGQNSIKALGEKAAYVTRVQLKDAGAEFDRLGLGHLDVLKVDTEGCEVEILESFGRRLAWIDYVLVEYHSERDRRRIDQLLRDFNVFTSRATTLRRGTVGYVNTRLLDRCGIQRE